ncbi:MAG: hypothetical protein N6V41_01360, partial [Candidatus Portiera aleyrodidarum]|nr:hypothetical protein [Candidatus Portiera aleyrodidarum]
MNNIEHLLAKFNSINNQTKLQQQQLQQQHHNHHHNNNNNNNNNNQSSASNSSSSSGYSTPSTIYTPPFVIQPTN